MDRLLGRSKGTTVREIWVVILIATLSYKGGYLLETRTSTKGSSSFTNF